ncbi:MAG: caspase family protein [Candidatus Thermoplasmatota archaeon]|nr:caspase family protein [Candidatus Thermoplasmatota archaeon]
MKKSIAAIVALGLLAATFVLPINASGTTGSGTVKYAVLVANWDDGTAAGGDYGLEGPKVDVVTVKNYLLSHGFLSSNIITLTCGKATAASISSAIQSVVAKCDADDEFVFYYSGHGSWLIESEIDLFNGEYVMESDFENAMTGMKSTNVFMCFDCCQSGGFAGFNPIGPHYVAIPMFEGLASGGWIVVSAASLVFSYDGADGGVFTNLFWRDGLANGEADYNLYAGLIGGTGEDSRVSVEEAFYYAKYALDVSNQESQPMMDDQYEGEFFI